MTLTSSTTRWDTVIVWFRRDLRVHDHPALMEAVANARRVVPLFVRDPVLSEGPRSAPARTWFLDGSLDALHAQLRERGSGLVVRRGRPEEVLPAVAREVGAAAVLVSRDVTPHARRRDRAVAAALTADGRTLHARRGLLLVEPDALPGRNGTGYTMFTPFWRMIGSMDRRQPLPAPDALPPLPDALSAGAPPAGDPVARDLPEPGEPAARTRLERWLEGGLRDYAERRNELAGQATSRLSQDLHLGLLSPLEIELRCLAVGASEAYRRQIAWREFYHHLLWHRPDLARAPFQARSDAAFRPESADPGAAAAWREGRTGIPAVDAGMRQLGATGWMSNRARLVVASFLTRHLLLDWRVGEAHFMRTLVDGDIANNAGGWQWTAGVGTDAQPWFRIFNPVTQGRRFDPQGDWVRTWVPELSRVPTSAVHDPWTLTPEAQRDAGVIIGRDYPAPIVDLAFGRERALAAFRIASAAEA